MQYLSDEHRTVVRWPRWAVILFVTFALLLSWSVLTIVASRSAPAVFASGMLAIAVFLLVVAIGIRGGSYVCAQCRYPVTRMGGSRCPVCGQDLSAPGVRTLAWQPRATIMVRAMAISGLALACIIVTWRVLPKREVDAVRMRLTVGEHDGGAAVDVIASGREWRRWRPRRWWGREPAERAEFTLSWVPESAIPSHNAPPLRLDDRHPQRIRAWLQARRGGPHPDDGVLVARIDRVMTFGCAGDLLRMLDEESQAKARHAGRPPQHRDIRLVSRYHGMYAFDWPDLMAAAFFAIGWITVMYRLWTEPSSRYAR